MIKIIQIIKRKIKLTRKKNSFDKSINLYIFTKDNMCFYSNSFEHFESYYKKIYVDEIYKFETQNSSPLIIDCGSNIGLATKYWKILYPNSEIISFEPDPEIFKALKKNTENLPKVKIHQLALSDQIDELEFVSNGKLSGSLNLSKELTLKIKVKTAKLSSFIQGKTVDFLKIDIEGEEIKVIQEIAPYLKNVDHIFIEYHSFLGQKQELSILTKILEECNFRYYIESERMISAPFLNKKVILNQDLQLNIWAKRNG